MNEAHELRPEGAMPELGRRLNEIGGIPEPGDTSTDRLGEVVAGFRVTHRIAEDPRTLLYRVERGPAQGYLRVLRRSLAQNPAVAARFIESAKLLQRTSHAGLASIVDVGMLADGCAYVLVQPEPGEPLAERIWRQEPLAPLAPALGTLAEALAVLHAQGVCYLGLQPERIQVGAGAGPALQLLDSEHVRAAILRLPTPTIANGSVREGVDPVLFMAPETFSGRVEIGPPADVYALGVLAYQVLCGRPPLQAETIGEVIAAHLNQAPVPVCRAAPGVPEELGRLIDAMLDKEPGRRPPMADVAEAWARLCFAPAARSSPATPEARAPAATPEPAVGSLLGDYRLIRKLGEGRTGEVFEAHHERLRRRDAIKVIRPELCRSPEDAERFLREAQAANQVAHPGIVSILSQARAPGGQIYTVMELLEGGSLRDRIERGPMPEAQVRGLCRYVALAMVAAHEHGVIHRDLKPENVMLVRDPDVAGGERTKIVDFGTANLTESTAAKGPYVEGTPAYMSPEQLRDTRTAGTKTDVFALGVIMQELLAGGRRPGRGDLPASCPGWLAALIRQMQDPDPSRRPDMQQVAARLASPPRPRRRWIPLSAAALVATAGLAVGVWQIVTPGPDDPTPHDPGGQPGSATRREPGEPDQPRRPSSIEVTTPEQMLILQQQAMQSGDQHALSALLRERGSGSSASSIEIRDKAEQLSSILTRLGAPGVMRRRQEIRYHGDVAWAMQELALNADLAHEARFVISQVMVRDRGSWKVARWHWARAVADSLETPAPPPVRGAANRQIATEVGRMLASKDAFISSLSESQDVINIGTNAELNTGGRGIKRVFERMRCELSVQGAIAGELLGPDVAWATANIDFRYGQDLERSRVFNVLVLLVKEPAGWKIMFSHWSRNGSAL